MKPVSVIVPVYNVAPWLPDCLAGLEAQRFRDFELILVDDGSTDESPAICDRFCAAHPYARVIHQENQGLSGARNTGIAAAQGAYLAFVDSDDTVTPDYLEKLYNACKRNAADMAICAVEDVNEDGSSLAQPIFTDPVEPGVFAGKALVKQFFQPDGTYYTVAWNKLYRASLWKELRYPQGRLHEDDAVAHYLFCNAGKVVCLKDSLYHYRLRNGSICRSVLKPAAFDGVLALADRYFYLNGREDITPEVKRLALAACWRRYLSLCGQVKAAPDKALVARLGSIQPVLRGMLLHLPTCRELTFTEKLSAARWSTMSPEKLVHL